MGAKRNIKSIITLDSFNAGARVRAHHTGNSIQNGRTRCEERKTNEPR
jgi:hypothetical protein